MTLAIQNTGRLASDSPENMANATLPSRLLQWTASTPVRQRFLYAFHQPNAMPLHMLPTLILPQRHDLN